MRLTFLLTTALLVANLLVDRSSKCDHPEPIQVERHWKCDRHLYPSYIGNAYSRYDDCWEVVPHRRLRRADFE